MIYDLVREDHPILRQKMSRFDFTNPPINPAELVNNLIETMVENKGLGLSANQVGLPYRCFVLFSHEPIGVFNPTVVDTTTEQVLLDEGCLSFKHLVLKIKRPKSVKVRYQTYTGEFVTETYTGMTARCFMHELDHLNGIDYTLRASKIHLDRAQRQRKQILRQLKREEELSV